MIRAALVLLLLAAPALAADRRQGLSSFDRVRVSGPFEVRIVPGSPSATLSGDRDALERADLRVDGTTLSLRMGGDGWGERPATASRAPLVVTLATPRLSSLAVFAGARVTAARMAGDQVDLSVSGAGEIAVAAAAAAEQFTATVIGAGTITAAGRARRARLVTNGPGTIDAGALIADDLLVRLDGPGETRAAARYTAQVANTGLGSVSVAGSPRCTVQSPGGGPVSCGR